MATDESRTLSQSVLRAATDRELLDLVIGREQATRAELATATGISKPTVSESVRRLVDSDLLIATGLAETGRRGRVATYYRLGPDAGWTMAITLDQSGLRSRATDLAGATLAEHYEPPGAPRDTKSLTRALRTCVRNSLAKVHNGPLRAVAVSVANPVHPETHEVTALPNSPFPEGFINPRDALAGVVSAPILVDNDVNLAALAEHRAGAAAKAGSFGYVYIGAGLGLGLYIGDQLIRGARGLAGEIGYLPGAGSRTLAAELAAQGFDRPDAPSNDVTALLHMLDSGRKVQALSHAVARAIASISAVVDPELVVLGGPIGTHPALLGPVRDALAEIAPAPIRVIHGELGELAPLHGAVHLAVERARNMAIRI